jgi:hypothetical protein
MRVQLSHISAFVLARILEIALLLLRFALRARSKSGSIGHALGLTDHAWTEPEFEDLSELVLEKYKENFSVPDHLSMKSNIVIGAQRANIPAQFMVTLRGYVL